MKILMKLLKVLLTVIFGGVIGWFTSIVMHVIAWDTDRAAMINMYDESAEYWHKLGIFKD